MNITERIIVNRPVTEVWPFVVQPEAFKMWNEKIISMEARDRFINGQIFMTHYKWKNKDVQVATTVIRLEENRLLELHHMNPLGSIMKDGMECTETVILKDKGAHTLVIKRVEIKNAGVPFWLLPLVWFVVRFGKTKPNKLKELCEKRI